MLNKLTTLWRFWYWRWLLKRVVKLLPGNEWDMHKECFHDALIELLEEYGTK